MILKNWIFIFLAVFTSVAYGSEVKIPQDIQSILKEKSCEPVVATNARGEVLTAAITGNFSGSTTDDWAFLCREKEMNSLLVIFSQPNDCPSNFKVWGDFLYPASIKYMQDHIDFYAPDKQFPKLTHAGVNVGIVKASQVYYCHEGRWLILPGAD